MSRFGLAAGAAALLLVGGACAQEAGNPKDTEQWEPKPPVVTPGATDAAAPSDAVVLFDH